MPNVGDWMKMNCGCTVVRLDDPRHFGTVIAICNSAIVRVKWNDNGWLEDCALSEVTRIASWRDDASYLY